MNLKPGIIIEGRYELLQELGSGGFATVFKARQVRTQQAVALKVLHELGRDAKRAQRVRDRFEREMVVVGRLHHPNLVSVIDTGILPDGEPYTVFEFVEGETLSGLIQREGALEPHFFKHLMIQILDALSCAHARGIVHRDLKPDNVMIASTGARRNAVICDFGMASLQAPEDGDKKLTAEGDIAGTPGYMAPEQIHGHAPTPRTDLYAWGLLAFECHTGECAVEGDSAMAILLTQSSDEPLDFGERIEDPVLRHILERATAKDPEKRYASATHILEALGGWQPPTTTDDPFAGSTLDGSVDLRVTFDPALFEVRPETLDRRAPEPAVTGAEEENDENPDGNATSLPPLVWAGAGALLAVIFTLLVVSLSGNDSDETLQDSHPPAEASIAAPSLDSARADVVEADASSSATAAQAGAVVEDVAAEPPPVACADGMVSEPEGAPCCWKGQRWSAEHRGCVGAPECPVYHQVTPSGCELTNESVWLAHNDCFKRGDGQSCFNLADKFLTEASGLVVSWERAQEYLSHGCRELGYMAACDTLRGYYLDSWSGKFNPEKGFDLARFLCDVRDNADYCANYALYLDKGMHGMPEDKSKAYVYFAKGCTLRPSSAFGCKNALELMPSQLGVAEPEALTYAFRRELCEAHAEGEYCMMIVDDEPDDLAQRHLEVACVRSHVPEACRRIAPVLEARATTEKQLEQVRKAYLLACRQIEGEIPSCIKGAQLFEPKRWEHAFCLKRACKYGDPVACESVPSD